MPIDATGSPLAEAGLQQIARLYTVEKKTRREPPATRQAIRWDESAPLVNRFGVWLDEQRSRLVPSSGSSPLETFRIQAGVHASGAIPSM